MYWGQKSFCKSAFTFWVINLPHPEEGWVLSNKMEVLFFSLLQCEWRKNGSGVLEIPSSSFEVGSIPLSIFTPFYHCNIAKNKIVVSWYLGIHRYPLAQTVIKIDILTKNSSNYVVITELNYYHLSQVMHGTMHTRGDMFVYKKSSPVLCLMPMFCIIFITVSKYYLSQIVHFILINLNSNLLNYSF